MKASTTTKTTKRHTTSKTRRKLVARRKAESRIHKALNREMDMRVRLAYS